MATNGEEFSARVTFSAEACKPFGSSSDDSGDNGDSFDVCDCGGTTKETDIGREGRLQSRFSLFSFQ